MKLAYLATAAVLAALVAGCGGGGGGSSVSPAGAGGSGNVAVPAPTPAAGGTTSSAAPQKIALSIIIPKNVSAAQSLRGKQYIPSNTAAMTLTLVSVDGVATAGAAQGPFNLTAPSPTNINPSCTIVQAGTSCTFSISAPPGTDIFTATTYSDAKGTVPLGSGSVAFKVVLNSTNTASLTLAGPVASVSLLSSTVALSNGNPIQPNASPTPSSPPLAIARTANTSGRRSPQLSATVTPPPLPATVPSARIFVIALDAAGNQIINPTTFDIPISVVLHLNGAPSGMLSLNVTYAGLSTADTGTASATTDGGTVNVFSPSDQLTLSIGSTTTPGTFAPSLVAQYTPQGGSLQSSAALAYTVAANPVGPTYGLALTSNPLTVNISGALTVTVTNGGTGPTIGQTFFVGEVDNGIISNFTGTSSYWNCSITGGSPPSFTTYTCNVAGTTIAANTTAPPITVNVTPNGSSLNSRGSFGDTVGGVSGLAVIPVSATATAALSLSAHSTTTTFYTGEAAAYALTVNNVGSAPSAGTITVTSTLSSLFDYTGFTGSNWSCNAAGQTVTCTYPNAIANQAQSPQLTLNATPEIGAVDTLASLTLALSGGGGTDGPGSSIYNVVQSALQIVSAGQFSSSYTFTPGDNALLDFGAPNADNVGVVTFRNLSVNSVQTSLVTDQCTSALIDNHFAGQFPLSIPANSTIDVPLDEATGGPGSCTMSFTTANGSPASLAIQVEQTGITVSGRKRK